MAVQQKLNSVVFQFLAFDLPKKVGKYMVLPLNFFLHARLYLQSVFQMVVSLQPFLLAMFWTQVQGD